MARPWFRRILLILVSAALYALALPPWSVTALAWIALVPFFLVLRDLTPPAAALAGLLWGTAAIWGVGYWVPLSLAEYYAQPLWFGLAFALAASVVFAASYSAGFAGCAAWALRRTSGAARPLLCAALWVSWELARARLLTGDPWLLIGYALVPATTLAQAADLGGVYLLSFVIVLVNASIAEAVASRARALTPAVVAVGLAYAYGMFRLAMPLPTEPAVPLAIIQGNNDLGMQWRDEFYGRNLADYARLTRTAAQASGAKLVVWPESAVTFFLAHEPAYQAVIKAALADLGADLIVGAPHYEEVEGGEPHYFNSAFYVTSAGKVTGRYDKERLLPFAEYFPLRTIELLRRHFERVRYFTPGDHPALLSSPIGEIATVICFEGIFPDLVRRQMAAGASLLVNLSNDTWLGRGAGPEQHLTMIVLRAIENRTWVVRATTTGISAIIDPFGRIRQRSALFTAATLADTVVPLRIDTVYKRFGDAFAYGCAGVSIVALLVATLSSRRRSSAAAG